MEKIINEFISLISDPRNISPDDFAEYYPKPGEFGNKKNLDKISISKYFSSLQRFKIPDNWNGYIPLQAKVYFLLESFNKLPNNEKEIYLNYFVLMRRDMSFNTQSYIKDKILSKEEYYNLIGGYDVFVLNLSNLILQEFKILLNNKIIIRANKGPSKIITKSLEEYIIKEGWDMTVKKAFLGKLKSKFKTDITEYNNKGKRQPLNLLALVLYDLKIIDQKIHNIELYESVAKVILNEIPNSQTNFDSFRNKGKNQYSKAIGYLTTEAGVKTIIKEIEEIYNLPQSFYIK